MPKKEKPSAPKDENRRAALCATRAGHSGGRSWRATLAQAREHMQLLDSIPGRMTRAQWRGDAMAVNFCAQDYLYTRRRKKRKRNKARRARFSCSDNALLIRNKKTAVRARNAPIKPFQTDEKQPRRILKPVEPRFGGGGIKCTRKRFEAIVGHAKGI